MGPASTEVADAPAAHRSGGGGASGALRLLARAVGSALRSAAIVFVGHTVVLGTLLVLVAYWAASGAGWWNGIAASVAVLAVHSAAAPFINLAAAMVASGSGLVRFGVARHILAAAAARAATLDPRVAMTNDMAVLSLALERAFDEMVIEVDSAVRRRGPLRRAARRLTLRLVRIIARAALGQLDLLPRADGTPPYATLDEWLGARLDVIAASAIREPGLRLLGLTLLGQMLLTAGAVFAARSLPGLPGASP